MADRVVDYLIVGGGVAGGHAVFEIRKHDKYGSIIVINRENQFPYDRPPLSKEYLAGEKERRELYFRANSYYARNKVEVIMGQTVQNIETSLRSITLDDGQKISYKALLIATGGQARRLEIPGSDLKGIYYLRTVEDCDLIKDAAAKSKEAAVIGGGFIGCEVSATLKRKGLKVTLIHKSPQLLNAAIDKETANWIQVYQSEKGVNVMLNTSVAKFIGENGKVKAVELSNGKTIPVGFVVVGIGIELNTKLAENAGLKTDNGVLVNEYLETCAKGVYAAGDIARFCSPIFKRNMRFEHVDVSQNQGKIAGMNMVGKKAPFDILPYFFSLQFDLEINAYGDLSKYTKVFRRGKLDAKTGFIQFYFDGAMLNGILSVNADWKEIEKAKILLNMRKKFSRPSLLSDEALTLASVMRKMKK